MKPGFLLRKGRTKGNIKTRETPKEIRNWLELPRDVMIHIFLKLGVIEILNNAQCVCLSWRKLAKEEPQLFRCIDMRDHWHIFDDPGNDFDGFDKMAREALKRSCGELVEFSMGYFGTDELMNIAFNESRSLLRCIRLVSCYQVSEDVLVDVCKKSPLLEELEMCHCSYTEEAIEAIGRSCPLLKSFRLNHTGSRADVSYLEGGTYNEEAFAVANSMPSLRRLHFFGNLMNNDGLLSILNGCPHLEYLDLRQCFRLDLKGDLLKKCVNKIKDLRLPNDPTDDYEFDATLDGEDVDPSDYESDDFDDGLYGF